MTGAMAYEKTEVSVDKSQAEIRRLLRDFGVQDMMMSEIGSEGVGLQAQADARLRKAGVA